MNPELLNIQAFARNKMNEWGLIEKGWSFAWNTRLSSFGRCRFRRMAISGTVLLKQIELSSVSMMALSRAEQEDTVLHEIAHALDFETRGTSDHGLIWKQWAIKVGARPERCKEISNEGRTNLPPSKYILRCPNGHEFARHRRLKHEASCPKCSPRYDERFKLKVIQNY